MTVYFVYRSHYDNPTGNYLRRFPDDKSVLAWFQRHWEGAANYDACRARTEQLLGQNVYGWGSLFLNIGEMAVPPPESMEELAELLEEHAYVNEIHHSKHSLQILTDDDELEMAYYFFDDQFLAKRGAKAAYLLQDGWLLPAEHGAVGFQPKIKCRPLLPKGDGEGTTWLAFLAYYDSGSLSDLDSEGPRRIEGVRLPDLARYLATATPPPGSRFDEGWPFELSLVRTQLLGDPQGVSAEEHGLLQMLRNQPQDEPNWQVYSDWLEEHGQPRAGVTVLERALRQASNYPVARICNTVNTSDFGKGTIASAQEELAAIVTRVGNVRVPEPDKSRFQVAEHMAQVCLHTDRWGEQDMYHRWILFDDLWASAHPELATAILNYARRWDALS